MITKADPGIWCDYCKTQWGRVKGGTWHALATTQANWTVHSKSPKSNTKKRHYCEKCLLAVTRFDSTFKQPGYFWALKDQVEAVKPIQLEMDGEING